MTTFDKTKIRRAGTGPNPGRFAAHTPTPAETTLTVSHAAVDAEAYDRVIEIFAVFDKTTGDQQRKLSDEINRINVNGRMHARERTLRGVRDLAAVRVHSTASDEARALYESRVRVVTRDANRADLQHRAFALLAAADAAEAVASRSHIGKAPGFGQADYDHLTGPWRSVFGPVHPDDAVSEPGNGSV
ncbi:hypothetical protein ACFVAJ_18645 [Agromyces sp. NPDC057679]|uniref:hypothetical protein n=1 Tax=Agromyces sp. NPDC057679 TaxID=3346207 RepID=UPI00366C844D